MEKMTFPDGPLGEPKFVEYTEPIHFGDEMDILSQCALLVMRNYPNYPDKKPTDQHQAIFCPDCGTLCGVANAHEVIAGEMHEDGRLNGFGTRVRVLNGPLAVACDEPGCDGEIIWPPEAINWSPWLKPGEIAGKFEPTISVRTLNRYIKKGIVRADSKTKHLIRIVLNGLEKNWKG